MGSNTENKNEFKSYEEKEKEYQGLPIRTLMWRKFKRNRLAVFSGVVLIIFYIIITFSGFFSPNHFREPHSEYIYAPPQRVRFFDEEGNFHLRPFVYPLEGGMDYETFTRQYEEDRSRRNHLQFFTRSGRSYSLFGILETKIRLVQGEDEPVFFLGTDQRGRDLLARTIQGGTVSLTIGFLGVFISITLGAIMGAISGLMGGWIDNIIQRLIEIVRSFPQIPLWMALSAAIPAAWPSTRVFVGIVVILGLIRWALIAREVRGKILSIREADFIMAARSAGSSDKRLIFKHLLPNVFTHMVVVATLEIPSLILAESTLSFLGLGIQPPMVSWGVLLEQVQDIQSIAYYPWLFFPGLILIISVLLFNFLGDGVRDAADPFEN